MPSTATDLDRRILAAAIRLGRTQLGLSAPNPSVGCVIVRNGIVVGMGVTGPGGRPHGETQALADAGSSARGATAYVSLEPCDHHGKTGPCSLALIEAGVARVVIALGDPDPRVSGAGVARLRAAGMDVVFEPFADMRAMARQAHRGHITRLAKGRPHVTLKLAFSLDGGIGLPGQGQIAITCARTNRLMHALRARMDAIAVGAATFRADAPQLSVRLAGLSHRSPQRFVLGAQEAPDGFHPLPGHDLAASLHTLGARGMSEVLVEGGGTIARALLEADLVDELVLLKGTAILGSEAIKPFAASPFDDLHAAGLGEWTIRARRTIASDQMMVLVPTR